MSIVGGSIKKYGSAITWLIVLSIFFLLRIDNSPRTYFQIDDQIVVWAVDDAVDNNRWQPDWYRLIKIAAEKKNAPDNTVRDEPLHDHHYNFSGHMLLSAAIIKPLRLLGITTPTIVLLHHIALFWDAISLLFIVLAARLLGGHSLALCSAVLYTVFPLAVQGSHYARPDALLTAMGSALFWLALKKEAMKHYVWLVASGITLGIATAGKASQLMLGIIPAVACCAPLLGKQQRNSKTLFAITTNGIALLLCVCVVLQMMFIAGDMSARDFWLSVRSVQLYYQNPQPPDVLEHYSYISQLTNILTYLCKTLGWLFILSFLLGVTHVWKKYKKITALILTLPILFFILYFSSITAFFDRSFCALASPIILLTAIGIIALQQHLQKHLPKYSPHIALTILATLLVCWRPMVIQYHLQTNLLRSHHNDKRLAFQQQLKQEWSEKYAKDFWIKNIDRRDIFSQKIPQPPAGNPRIYMVEDLNDFNSKQYLQKLRDNGFISIAQYDGAFADMPTNSLITAHEAAHFVYFVRQQDMQATSHLPSP